MNPLFAQQCTAGSRLHEEMFGARLRIFDLEIPCNHSKLIGGSEFQDAGGKSPLLMIESVSFRAEHFGSTKPDKDVICDLKPANAETWTPLKLGPGGLMCDGLQYEFMAVDRHYGA